MKSKGFLFGTIHKGAYDAYSFRLQRCKTLNLFAIFKEGCSLRSLSIGIEDLQMKPTRFLRRAIRSMSTPMEFLDRE